LLPAQERNPTQAPQRPLAPETIVPTPLYRIEVVERTTPAVNYLHRSGPTRIDFRGTPLMPASKGSARVESQRGVIKVSADFERLSNPSSFGREYLTYVLWAVSPDGRPVNLGELTLSDYGAGSHSKIEATSDVQTFGLIVTAEPYYAVTTPSDVVVMENLVRPDTAGVVTSINAKYELLPRGTYTMQGRAPGFVPVIVGKKDPLELYEAQNAVQLARVAGAQTYATDSFQKANDALQQAMRYQNEHPGQKPAITMAREAALRAEDARVITLRRQKEEAAENERRASLARENAEKAKAASERAKADAERARAEAARLRADEEAQARARADAERLVAERAKSDALAAAQAADRQKREADQARQAADQARLSADQARQAADVERRAAEEARQSAVLQQQQLAADVDRARQAAADSDRYRHQAEEDQAKLRRQLLEQFNAILQTRDTTRGLIVNISDVLFDTAQYALKPGAREKLAKVSGIILSHPGLKIALEGHTDSVGGDEYNMTLSENRASSVRSYLISQGIDAGNVTAHGFGKTRPVADNNSAAGRQMNRRVEMVVSGEILGTSISSARSSSSTTSRP
jgi:outer membrane protein OmpA-like peptidoglycan-associated protein